MTQTLFALSLGFAGLILATTAGHSQTSCGPREAVLAHLNDTYGETRRGMGIANNNAVMEVYASAASGSWTITVTLPDGRMCLIASGQGFEPTAEELPAKGRKI